MRKKQKGELTQSRTFLCTALRVSCSAFKGSTTKAKKEGGTPHKTPTIFGNTRNRRIALTLRVSVFSVVNFAHTAQA